jgi:OOP family OmpA-OmpF porin
VTPRGAASRAAALAVLALACGRTTTSPSAEAGPAHCERDLAAARVCTTPSSRASVSKRDTDRDEVPDARDCCPLLPEDLDDFEDHDGCPDCDDDRDGFLDAEWLMVDQHRYWWTNAEGYLANYRCNELAEDFDGVDDHDGCPEGIELVIDSTTCAEAVARERQAAAARPAGFAVLARLAYPIDTDGDGYDDSADECRNLAEDFDAFDDHDGCPDCDNDQDGIPDADTWVRTEYGDGWANRDRIGELDCRHDPEDFDGDRDHDGCPDDDAEPSGEE